MNARDIQRRAELKAFLGADLEKLIAQQEKQERARFAAADIHYRIIRMRASVGDIRGK